MFKLYFQATLVTTGCGRLLRGTVLEVAVAFIAVVVPFDAVAVSVTFEIIGLLMIVLLVVELTLDGAKVIGLTVLTKEGNVVVKDDKFPEIVLLLPLSGALFKREVVIDPILFIINPNFGVVPVNVEELAFIGFRFPSTCSPKGQKQIIINDMIV